MRKQKDISRSNIKKYRGRRMTVLLEEQLDSGAYTGRTSFQAPEVDGMTYIQTKATWPYDLKPGCFIQVRMTDTIEYDLIGEPE